MAGNEILELLIDTYYYRKKPIYISNKDIYEFFVENKNKISRDDFICIRNYFQEHLKANRSIFSELEKWYSEPHAETRVLLRDGTILRKSYPRHYQEFKNALKLKRYSPKTVKIYLGALSAANDWCFRTRDNLIDDVAGSAIYDFFLYMTNEKKASISSIRIHRFAISLYFRQVLGREIDLSYVEGLRDAKRLPVVLSRDEIQRMLDSINNLKHRTMLALMYSSGLRLAELVGLKVGDIGLQDLAIRVREGKGRKDRITIFSEKIRDDIGRFMTGKGPDEYLFQSPMKDSRGRHCRLSGRTVQKVFENALKRAGIGRKATPHDLRHSFATHLLENGISIRHIQQLLGHRNITTTTIYTKVYNPQLKGIRSPL
ncbi:MAG TPA: tyrosine-type recombinase/integrase [Spirochaetota bacterium]|nr:tyrosine-type recombinase/integrase [Spirochaetota bacterium]